ncbi:hypothetical protein [Natrinema salsiterrestre]|uniref:Uncharacterized protein n=1 Tax=Natrinema salsiterrestre TaxID=2950540 RepID=A0A9Q4KYL0_9EURY|nr:hypothetical protein [Natrinema salsiterrestre]MDF9744411.1 hypothetical protein [Natrinema salsiterrestre]
MNLLTESRFRTIEAGLALLVLFIATITFADLPQPYPAWPTVAGLPVNPELIFPGLLAIAALIGAVRDGIRVSSIVIVALSVPTVWMAAMGVQTLLYPEPSGGLFVTGFFSLIFGAALAIAVIVRGAARRMGLSGISHWVRNRLDGT